MLHELFHGVQPRLGLMVENPGSERLDTPDGRYWLRLEWRALARALRESGRARAVALGDALAFRRARRARFPGADENERRIELLGGMDSAESFVRTFAYASGPAYGLLLDAAFPDRRGSPSCVSGSWTSRAGDSRRR